MSVFAHEDADASHKEILTARAFAAFAVRHLNVRHDHTTTRKRVCRVRQAGLLRAPASGGGASGLAVSCLPGSWHPSPDHTARDQASDLARPLCAL
eukprot:30314-Prymnesium_polylepis.1